MSPLKNKVIVLITRVIPVFMKSIGVDADAGGGLADRGDLARGSPTTPFLLDPGGSRASTPPLYIHLHLWSCSVALRSPPTWPSLMRVRAAVLRRGAFLRKNRQLRHPCAPRVYSGRQHSGSSPTQTLGHAPFGPELEIAIFAPAAPKLKVLR